MKGTILYYLLLFLVISQQTLGQNTHCDSVNAWETYPTWKDNSESKEHYALASDAMDEQRFQDAIPHLEWLIQQKPCYSVSVFTWIHTAYRERSRCAIFGIRSVQTDKIYRKITLFGRPEKTGTFPDETMFCQL